MAKSTSSSSGSRSRDSSETDYTSSLDSTYSNMSTMSRMSIVSSTPSKSSMDALDKHTLEIVEGRIAGDVEGNFASGISIVDFVVHVWGVDRRLATSLLGHTWTLLEAPLLDYDSATEEKKLYAPFSAMASALVKEAQEIARRTSPGYIAANDADASLETEESPIHFWSALGTQPLRSSLTFRKPDMLVVDKAYVNITPRWPLVRHPAEFKPFRGKSKKSSRISTLAESYDGASYGSATAASGSKRKLGPSRSSTTNKRIRMQKQHIQLATYSLECLNASSRHYVGGLWVNRFKVGLWYYDRSCVISSLEFDFKENPELLALVLYALSACDDQHAGFDPYLSPCSPLPTVNAKDHKGDPHWQEVVGFTFKFPDSPIYPGPRQYRIKGTIFASRGLIGRGTMVYRVASLEDNLKEDAAEDEALKICWPHRNRKLEGDTLECLRKRLPARWHDHIPEVTFSATATAEDLRLPRVELLKLSAIKDFERKDRQLHILVMKLYKKLWEAGSPEEFMEIYLDCVECHHASYTKGRVLHRDLSENNLMFKTAPNGSKKGILNDWDLASEVEDDNEIKLSNANHRTGTLPFMARDLLVNEPPSHLYRHDLESFFYILIWAALHYDFATGTKISSDKVSVTRAWDDDVFRRNRTAKDNFIKAPKQVKEVIAAVRKGCEPLIPWITSIWRLFFIAERAEPVDGYDNEVAVEWDNATLGGHVTFETFMKALGRKPRDDSNP